MEQIWVGILCEEETLAYVPFWRPLDRGCWFYVAGKEPSNGRIGVILESEDPILSALMA
jgi:hypothetical protein